MASSSSSPPKPASPQIKKLSDLLQEQQEPFLLDVYLLERGYANKILNSKTKDKKRKTNPQCPKILRCILNKLTTSVTDNRKLPNCDSTITNADQRNRQAALEFDQFSSASITTLFESCSESDIEEESQSYQQQPPPCSSSSSSSFTNRDQEAPTDRSRTNQWGCIEDSKQHSPVSVLDELHFDEAASPLHIHSKTVPSSSRTSKKKIPSTSSKKITEKSIFSASLWELLAHTLVEKQGYIGITEVQELLGTTSSSQYLKTKRVLEQTKLLLFDCVREAVKIHRNKGRRQQRCMITELLGGEELGKIICEQICSWGKQSGNLTNITHLLKSDFWVSKEEWNDFQPEIREIGMDIGDAILDDISNEIVTDMVDCFLH